MTISLRAVATAIIAVTALSAASPVFAQATHVPQRTTPNYPDPSPSTYSCSDELGHLRRVHAGELVPVRDPSKVWVTPICVDDSMFRNVGNAGALRSAIARNGAMTAALEEKAFTPEDVVGVRMTGPDKVTLYVNRDDRY
jgi:hypothetical protein